VLRLVTIESALVVYIFHLTDQKLAPDMKVTECSVGWCGIIIILQAKQCPQWMAHLFALIVLRSLYVKSVFRGVD